MKNCMVFLIILIFVFNNAMANDDRKKEKKAIVKTIKKEYVSWLVRDNQDWLTANSSVSENMDSINKAVASISHLDGQKATKNFIYVPEPVVPTYKLREFKFQIKNNQAVVKFMVDQHLKSAFLEKESGVWKLLIVADQSPSL